MSNSAAKPATSKPEKPLAARAPSTSPGSAAVMKPNSGSKPHALTARTPAPITAETRRAMIAEAAYYIAEQRGFSSGRDIEDWLLAEQQVDAALSS